jgi:hypothetical protein
MATRRAKSSDHRTVETLEQIPNIGPSLAEDLRSIAIRKPRDLVGKDPRKLYDALCKKTRERQDPCVLDTFIAATRFMSGDTPQPWWHYTAERKKRYADLNSKGLTL